MLSKEWEIYRTQEQVEQYRKYGKLQTKSRRALEKSLSYHYKVGSWQGRGKNRYLTLDSLEGIEPNFVYDKRLLNGKSTYHITMIKLFCNYISQLSKRDDLNGVCRMTRKRWLLNTGCLHHYPDMGALECCKGLLKSEYKSYFRKDTDVANFISNYAEELNNHIAAFYYRCLPYKAIGVNAREVVVMIPIKSDEIEDEDQNGNKYKKSIEMDGDALAFYQATKSELLQNEDTSKKYWKTRVLNTNGYQTLEQKLQCVNVKKHWLEVEINLIPFNEIEVTEEEIKAVHDAFMVFRAKKLIDKDYGAEDMSELNISKLAEIELRRDRKYYECVSLLDEKLGFKANDALIKGYLEEKENKFNTSTKEIEDIIEEYGYMGLVFYAEYGEVPLSDIYKYDFKNLWVHDFKFNVEEWQRKTSA